MVRVAGAKRKYIEAAYNLLARDGLEGVSIRKVADEIGCSSTALYRHFPDVDKLIAVASVRFLRDYISNARILSKVDLNPMELNLQLWECLAYYSFRDADVFENMFFSDASGKMYSEALAEYFSVYPEDLDGLRDFMLDMVRNATIVERDSILLGRAVEMGMLSEKSADYLCRLDSYLYRGMLTSLSGCKPSDREFRESTLEFMQLMIRSYTTQLEEGYSILVVNSDFDVAAAGNAPASQLRKSFRVEVTVVPCGGAIPSKGKATA